MSSTYDYPNANPTNTASLGNLVMQLLPKVFDPALQDVVDHIIAANACDLVEIIIHSAEIRSYHTFDPALVRQIEDVLRQCR